MTISNVVFEGIWWNQGENDSGDNHFGYTVSGEFYLYQCLVPMITRLRNSSVITGSSRTVPFVASGPWQTWLGADPTRQCLYNDGIGKLHLAFKSTTKLQVD
jgi:hypothetical protein